MGIFLRSYHFSRWLHFEVDQTYDFNIVSPAVEKGIGNLPLLGPTVGGGRTLRLGPSFYYLEYISAMIFGNTPQGHAMGVLILSITALPLFYIFCRQFFSRWISLGLMAVFSFSFYSILYSRFSWSPNVLPFLMIVTFYATLQSLRKNIKHPGAWFLLTVFLAAITTQIHFNAFFVVPPIIFGLLIYKRPRFNWKIWVAGFALILTVYTPIIINEVATGKQDLGFFNKNISKRLDTGIKLNNIGFISSLWATIEYDANEYFLINTGIDRINKTNFDDYVLDIDCQGNCIKNISSVSADLLIIILFLAGIIFLTGGIIKEKETHKKDFLVLSGLWLLFSSIDYFFLIYSDYQMRPRFFLIVSPLAIIFLGLILDRLSKLRFNKKIISVAIILIFGMTLYLNIIRITNAAKEMKNNLNDYHAQFFTEDVLPNSNRVTMEQEIMVAQYIKEKYMENNAPVNFYSSHKFEGAIWYFLERDGLIFSGGSNNKKITGQIYNLPKDTEILSPDNNNFVLLPTATDLPKFLANHSTSHFSEIKKFGTLSIVYVAPGEGSDIIIKKEPKNISYSAEKSEIAKLLTWNKILLNR